MKRSMTARIALAMAFAWTLAGNVGVGTDQAAAQTITQIIDATGDGAGNVLNGAFGIAVDAAGNVYVAGAGSHNAFKITPAGVITQIIDATGDGAGNILDTPFGIAVDAAGNAYVAGEASNNAFKITSAGIIAEIIDSTGDGAGNVLSVPFGIAVDAAGNAYVTGFQSLNAFKIPPAGVIAEIIDITGDGAGNLLLTPRGITVDAAGNTYVSGQSSDNAFKITPAGVITQIIDAAGDGAGNVLSNAETIAVDAAGNVYVAGQSSDNAFKITPAGAISEIIDAAGDGAGNSLGAPQDIAVDAAGNVYVAGAGSNNAFWITPTGVITQIINATGDGAGNVLNNTEGIAVDAAGNVYVTGGASANAFKITPPPPPPNDDCSAAISIPVFPGLPSSEFGDTTLATLDPAAPACGLATTAPGVWYSVIGTGDTITATTCNGSTGYDTQISVYCGGCSGLTCVDANNDDPMCGTLSMVSWCSALGEEYLIMVHGSAGATGFFELDILDDGMPCSPPVTCSGACCDPAAGFCSLETSATCAALGGTFLGAGTTCSPLACLGACCDPAGGVCSLETPTSCAALGGTFIGLGTTCGGALCPPNDDCSAAISIPVFPGLPSSEFGDTTLATLDPAAPPCGPTVAPGVWYSVIGTGNTIMATTCNGATTYDTQISVYCGGCLGLTCVAANNDDPVCGTLSTVSWCSAPGVEYLILVHGFAGATGFFELDIFDDGMPCPPPLLSWSFVAAVPPDAPSSRKGHAMAYDSARGVTVLFGGSDGSALGDTWEWDGSAWIEVALTGPSPSPRFLHAMVYDALHGVTLLFGGGNFSATPLLDDTWAWNGSVWALVAPSGSGPSPREEFAMAYDSASGMTVLYGGTTGAGISDETWVWDGLSWGLASIGGPPGPRHFHAMAYDGVSGATLLFGGESATTTFGDTWGWDGVSWTLKSLAGPGPRAFATMAYDSARGMTVLFGGVAGSPPPVLGDTWEWDGVAWAPKAAAGPSPRFNHAMAYDSARGETVLFGGWDGGTFYGDTWEWGLAPDCPTCACPGDVSGDAVLDGLDIPGFVRCLTGVPLPFDDCACVDTNGDGVADLGDIPSFVTGLLSGLACP